MTDDQRVAVMPPFSLVREVMIVLREFPGSAGGLTETHGAVFVTLREKADNN